jgi:hypothetical protein
LRFRFMIPGCSVGRLDKLDEAVQSISCDTSPRRREEYGQKT